MDSEQDRVLEFFHLGDFVRLPALVLARFIPIGKGAAGEGV